METVQNPVLSEPSLLTLNIPDVGAPGATHRLACWQWGDAQAAHTVVCVHGLTRNGRDFDVLARALAADYRVLCPDIPGRGKSEWLHNPKDYNYPAYVADMLHMLGALRLSRVYWVGTSMGGIIGMMLANTRPGLIEALVLNDIGCMVSMAGLKRIAAYAGTRPVFAGRAHAEAALRERCAAFGIETEAQWQVLFAHSFQENPDGSVVFACDPDILAGMGREEITKDIDLWPLWEAVTKIPALLIHGAQSDILSEKTAAEMKMRHPRLTLHDVSTAGHAPALMADDQVNLICGWFKSP